MAEHQSGILCSLDAIPPKWKSLSIAMPIQIEKGTKPSRKFLVLHGLSGMDWLLHPALPVGAGLPRDAVSLAKYDRGASPLLQFRTLSRDPRSEG
ncbi:hypothetical protein [Pseudomonas sp. NUPR-001]|uniref:hypothetical protein n=1 Tax=Pseudomonas sp. NUPR-001 TaxID=3416058 RepID=UPI003F982251